MLSAPLKKQDIFNSGSKEQAAESSSWTSGEDVWRWKPEWNCTTAVEASLPPPRQKKQRGQEFAWFEH